MEQPDTEAAGVEMVFSFGVGTLGFCRDRTKTGAKSYSREYHRSDSVGLLTLDLRGQFLLPALGEAEKEKKGKSDTLEGKMSRDKELYAP